MEARRFAVAADFLVVDCLAFAPVADAAALVALADDFTVRAGVFAALARARVFAAAVRRFAGVVFAPVVAAAPDDTRVECLTRCFTIFFGAASATEAAANATSRAARSTLKLRIMTLR